MKLLKIARCAIFVSYMATCLQGLFLISKTLNNTLDIRLQNILINGVDLIVLGSHERFSYFPKCLTLHNRRKHYHTYLVLLSQITVCTLCAVCFAHRSSGTRRCCGKPQGLAVSQPAAAGCRARARCCCRMPCRRGSALEDGLQQNAKQKAQGWEFPRLPCVLCEELEGV